MDTPAAKILQELEALGTDQNRKIFRRHGAIDPLFGVSFANLEKFRKRIKVNHDLSGHLWNSGNYDARILAMMVADPAALTDREADTWAKQLDCYPITDQLAGVVAKSPLAQKKVDKWIKSKDEWVASAAWGVVNRLALWGTDLPDPYFEGYLKTIKAEIHKSQNRVRHSMNNALIGIGCRNALLKAKALAVAAAIGEVKVDHGETACKTPAAAAYVEKVWTRKK